jgi:hypothetical protein
MASVRIRRDFVKACFKISPSASNVFWAAGVAVLRKSHQFHEKITKCSYLCTKTVLRWFARLSSLEEEKNPWEEKAAHRFEGHYDFRLSCFRYEL